MKQTSGSNQQPQKRTHQVSSLCRAWNAFSHQTRLDLFLHPGQQRQPSNLQKVTKWSCCALTARGCLECNTLRSPQRLNVLEPAPQSAAYKGLNSVLSIRFMNIKNARVLLSRTADLFGMTWAQR